jgi:hypothetical protein
VFYGIGDKTSIGSLEAVGVSIVDPARTCNSHFDRHP